jgi:hypothetical protein
MNKKTLFCLIIIGLISSNVYGLIQNDKFRIIKDAPYVPVPIIDKEKYISENYIKVINSDESISYIKVIK